ASAAALAAFAALTGAHAQPASIGRTLQLANTAFVTVDYYHPRYYGYRDEYNGDGPLGLLKIPGALLGGVADLLSGGDGDTYYGDPYYYRPRYVSPYYGSPYRDAYNGSYYGNSYYDRLYNGDSYYFSSRTAARGYYDDRRHFRPDRYDGDREYNNEYRV